MKRVVPYESLEPGRKALVVVFLAVTVWYLIWRLGTFNKEALFFSYLLYGAELYGVATTLLHLFMTWRLTVRVPPPAPDGITVDVFIPTYNEPVSLLRKTLLAAINIEYPHQTWLLDDGKRPEMEELAEELGCRYLSRADNAHAKAGNLNNALRYSTADFVAIFDADHAPKRTFLTRTLGYFDDPSVAFVQTPQDFYNLDSFQHQKSGSAAAWHEQMVFFRVIQRGKDYWNAAFFCGSCAVIRRSALDAIGGIATGTVTEDLHTSLKIHKKGLQSVYHPEPLAFGLAPAGMAQYLVQRIRWGQGAMQVWRQEGVFFCRGLTMAQRINYVASTITYFDGWQKGLFYIFPAIVLVSGVMPIISFGREFLLHFIPYFVLTFWIFEEVNRGYGRSIAIEQYNMARFAAMAWSTLGLVKRKIKFAVTPKEGVAPSTFERHLAPQAVILVVNVVAIPAGCFLYLHYRHLPLDGLIANIVWALVNSGLALSVTLLVTACARFRRSEYRFPIPLPATVHFRRGDILCGTIDDISSTGFRLYADLPYYLKTGNPLTGTIYLPSGPLEITAVTTALIKDRSNGYIKAAGCKFLWLDKHEHDRLDLFLYGSDVQYALRGLKETMQTPLSALWSRKSDSLSGAGGKVQWNAATISSDGVSPEFGLISVAAESAPQWMVSFSRLPAETTLEVEVYTRQKSRIIHGVANLEREIELTGPPLLLYRFSPQAARETVSASSTDVSDETGDTAAAPVSTGLLESTPDGGHPYDQAP